MIGQNGVEGTYDNWLRGEDGTKRVTIDATGTPLSDQVVRAARSGYRLRLTIDKTVQAEAEQALADGVKRRKGERRRLGRDDRDGPNTGAIRAIASYPNFNPNWFVSPEPRRQNRGHLRYLTTSKTTPQLNRAITGLYPAASTFKPFTAIAAVQSGVLPNIYDTILCSGKVKIAGHVFNNWDPSADMPMSLPTALSQSCDTYFYELGYAHLQPRQEAGLAAAALGRASSASASRRASTSRARARGILPTQAWRRDVHQGDRSTNYEVDRQWRPGDSVLLAIGQGALEVTPLQIAVGYAAIANGGYVVTPHIGEDIEDDSERHARDPQPREQLPAPQGRARARPAAGDPHGPRGGHARRQRHLGARLLALPARRRRQDGHRARRRASRTPRSSRATRRPTTPSSSSSC